MYTIPPGLKLISPSKLFGKIKLGQSLSVQLESKQSQPSTSSSKAPITDTLTASSVLGFSLNNVTFTEQPLPFNISQEELSVQESLGLPKTVDLKNVEHQTSIRNFLSQIDTHIDTNSELQTTISNMMHGDEFMAVLNKAQMATLSKDDIKAIQTFLSRSAGFDLSYGSHKTGIDGGYGDKTHKALQGFFKQPSQYASLPLAKKDPYDSGVVMGIAKGTGYYPHDSALEGGFVDKRDTALRTLQDYLAGKAEYVSVALDKHLYRNGSIKYGDKFRIPELEKKYGRVIEFRAVDTGGAFTNKGFNRIDICTGGYRHSVEKTVNGQLTLIKLD